MRASTERLDSNAEAEALFREAIAIAKALLDEMNA